MAKFLVIACASVTIGLLENTFFILFAKQIQTIEQFDEFVLPANSLDKLIFLDLRHLVSDNGSGVQLDRFHLEMRRCWSSYRLGSGSWRLIPGIVRCGDGLKQVLIGSYAIKNPNRLLHLIIFHGPLIQGLRKRRQVVILPLRLPLWYKIHALIHLHGADLWQNGPERFLLLLVLLPVSGATLLIFTFLDVFE